MPEQSTPSPLARWLLAARPKTLPLTLSPVIAGLALAGAATGTLAVWTARHPAGGGRDPDRHQSA